MNQLAAIEYLVCTHTSSDEDAGALLYGLLLVLGWDIEGISNAEDATAYLNSSVINKDEMFK